MASLHVIYDPNDRIEHNPEFVRQLGVSFAVLRVDGMDADPRSIEIVTRRLCHMLISSLSDAGGLV